ncbi:MAG TPA: methyltransferase [Acidimicrobiales bacterium]|nr:methyltransferase [Acidimicrobiales bacterium]
MGRPTHYFSSSPEVPSRPSTVRLDLPDLSLELRTDRGVFSGTRIDPGTKYLLVQAPPPPATGHLADIGCGYGAIALTLAARSPGATVWAVDVNERALDLTRANAAAGGLTNVRVASPDDVPADVRFAAWWSNPPVRVGKAALHDLLARWMSRLDTDGTALLVVQKQLGADSLQRWLAEQGWSVRRLGSRVGYRLLEVRGVPE